MGSCCNNKETKYGLFICPICKKKSGYDKWQKRDDKWIFHRDNAWYASSGGIAYDFAEDCWKKTGGSTVEKWNTIGWVCGVCNYPAKTFLDYVVGYKSSKEEELSKEKRKNDFLIRQLNYQMINNNILNKEADFYADALIKKQREIQNLNTQIKEMENEMF